MRFLLVIAYIGFVSLGLPDTLLGVAWPSVRETFNVQQSSLGWVFLASGCGYFFSSFFSGRILQLIGIGALLAASTGVVALSGTAYGFAPVWLAFVGAAILHGLGSGGIDSGLNHYAAHHFSAQHMTWLHACYSLGATFGPMIMTAAVLWAGSWRTGYAVMAVILLGMCILFTATRGLWKDEAKGSEASDPAPAPATMAATLAQRAVWLQVALFFVYTGLEVTVGQWSFTLLTESRGVSIETAGLWVTAYWGSIGVGRVLFGFVVERLGPDRLVRGSTFVALAGCVLIAVGPGWLTLVGLALTGLALAPIFPCMMTRTPARLGRQFAAHAIGFQVSAAMIGAAVLPASSGLLARNSLEAIAWASIAMALGLLLLHEVLLRQPEHVLESGS